MSENTRARRQAEPNKIAVRVISAVLVVALMVSAVCGILPGTGLKVAAASTMLESVSGNNYILEQYEAVNVPKNTYTMTPAQYQSNTVGQSLNGIAAFDFHIFADRFASGIHTCGNIAVENLGAPVLGNTGVPEFGSRAEHDTLASKVSYIGNTTSWSAAAISDIFVFGENNAVTGDGGQVNLINSSGQSMMMGNGTALLDQLYIDNEDEDGTPYIDINAELEEAEAYQRYLVWVMEQAEDNNDTYTTASGEKVLRLDYNDLSKMVRGWSGATLDFSGSKYKDYDTIIIDFDTYEYSGFDWWTYSWTTSILSNANSVINGQTKIKGNIGKRIIFNVDTTDLAGDSIGFYNITMTADKLSNTESSVEKDNNILWNFYSKENGNKDSGTPISTTGTITLTGTWIGTVLAPDATVNCGAGLNGSIIARNVTTSCETHKSDYTGEYVLDETTSITVTKRWNDNPALRPAYISVKLLRNGTAIETVQLSADKHQVSDNVWEYTFSNLEAAEPNGTIYRYSVEEIVPAGYTGTQVNNTIINSTEGGLQESVEPVYGKMTVNKKDTSGNMLAGAQFTLTHSSGTSLAAVTAENADNFVATDGSVTWTSKTTGATLSNLPLGTYTISETKAPDGYLTTTSQTVTITEANETTAYEVNFTNQKNRITIAKVESVYKDLLPGAKLKVTPDYDGISLSNVTVSGANDAVVSEEEITWTSSTSEVYLEGMPVGSYTLTETAAPAGYDIAAPISFMVNDGGYITINYNWASRVEMVNTETVVEEETYDVTVKKVDGEGEYLPGAVLKLTSVAGKDLSEVTVNGSAVSGDITWTTGSSSVAIGNLPAGSYIVSEVSAPEGYAQASQITFTVNANTTEFEYTMVDKEITMDISKKDSGSGLEISGAKLKLESTNYKSLDNVISDTHTITRNGTYIEWTSNGEAISLSRLPEGSYKLSETEAPVGYRTADPIEFNIDKYGNISGTNISGTTCTMYDTPVTINVLKNYLIPATSSAAEQTGVLPGATLQLSGVDAAGAKIDLSAVTGSIEVEHTSNYRIRWQSGSAANTLRGLPDGTYTLHEVTAPEGFDVAADIVFTVEDGVITTEGISDNSITMVDKKQSFNSLVFSKVELGNTENYVKGATLAIFKADTKSFTAEHAVYTFESTDTYSGIMLADGDYVICELAAPGEKDNAEVDAETGETVYVQYEQSNEKVYFNVFNGNLTVTRVDDSEVAAAGHGNPKDSGLALNDDCYFTLETTEIFKKYGEFPEKMEINAGDIPTGYTVTSFVLYEDVVAEDGTVTATPVVSYGTSDTLSYAIAESAEREYNANSTYYAAITIVDSDSVEVTADEIETINFNFIYPELEVTKADYVDTHKVIVNEDTTYQEFNATLVNGNANKDYPTSFTFGFDYLDTGAVINVSSMELTIWDSSWGQNTNYSPYDKWSYSGSEISVDYINNSFTLDVGDEYYTSLYTPNHDDGNFLIQFKITYDYINDNKELDETGNPIYNGEIELFVTANYSSSTSSGSGDGSGNVTVSSSDITVEELQNNYTKNDFVTTEGGETAYIMFPNARVPEEEKNLCAVKLIKKDQDGTEIKTDTASFLLYDSEGNLVEDLTYISDGVYKYDATVTNPANTEENPLLTNMADGTLMVSGLNEGSYYFLETEAPNDYEIATEKIEFILNLSHVTGSEKEVTAVNNKKTGSLNLSKVDDAGNAREGATFELYRVDLNQIWSTTPESNTSIGEYTTGDNGKVEIPDLELGYLYYAVETGAPSGLENSNAGVKLPQLTTTGANASKNIINGNEVLYGVILSENANIAYVEDGNYDINTGAVSSWTQETISITEREIGVTDTAYRTTFIKNDDSGNALAGATFKLTAKKSGNTDDPLLANVSAYVVSTKDVVGNDGNTYTEEVRESVAITYDVVKNTNENGEVVSYGAESITWTSTDDAQGVTLFGLPSSVEYDLEEISAPDGYKAVASQTVTAATDADGKSYTINNEKLTGEVSLVKMDSETAVRIDGVQFKLWQSTDSGSTWSEYGTYTTGANGTPGEIKATGLPYGAQYRFEELAAPSGYNDVTDATKYSSVVEIAGENLSGNVKMYNTKKTGTVTLTKTEAGNDSVKIEGAGYKLFYKANGADDATYAEYPNLGELKTNADGQIVVKNLPWGYTYKFQETTTPAGYVKYDGYTGEAILTADSVDGAISHTNTALVGELDLTGTKAMSGREMNSSDIYTFEISGDNLARTEVKNSGANITFPTIPYTKADLGKTYTYTVKELATDIGGVTIDPTVYTVTVEVKANASQTAIEPVVTINNGGSIKFTNSYAVSGSVSVQLGAKKTLTGKTLAAEQFSFTLTGDGQNQTKKNAADGTVTFDAITYDAVGTHTYTIAEVNDGQGGITYDSKTYTVVVDVTDNGSGGLAKKITLDSKDGAELTDMSTIAFANTYSVSGSVSAQLGAKKTLTGKTLAAEQFSFTLTGDGQNQTKKNAADGTVTFDAITYDAVGTHTYTIAEVNDGQGGITYDSKTYTVVVDVTDDGQGGLAKKITLNTKDGPEITDMSTLSFTNSYAVSGSVSVQLGAKKTLTGKTLAANQFSFTLSENGSVLQTKKNASDGTVTFDAITYDAVGTHTYTIAEVNDGQGGIAYDSKTYTVVVDVTDNGNGGLAKKITLDSKDGAEITDMSTIAFANSYSVSGSASAQLGAKKTLSGKTLAANQFSFTLSENGSVLQTKKNASDGTVTFDAITYDAVGTHTYTIAEVNDGQGGITYDSKTYTVVVDVTDNGSGGLAKKITLDSKDGAEITDMSTIAFANTYSVSGSASAQLGAKKTLSGKTLAADMFSFTLSENGNVLQTKKNAADGTVTFDAITYDAVGTHTYTIAEVNDGQGGIAYDSKTYTVVVDVTDNGNGGLAKKITMNSKDGAELTDMSTIAFANTYSVSGSASAQLGAKKTLTGKTLAAEQFSFTLSENGNVLQTKKNAADGTVTFDAISYDAVGTHTYTIAEVNDGQGGITYDSKTYTVVVDVTDNGSGGLAKKITLDSKDGAEITDMSTIAFANTYSVSGSASAQLGAKKTLTGKTLAAEQFSFTLSENGNVLQTKKNAADGTVTFDAISYDAVGTHTYTIAEVNDGQGGITYDSKTYTVVVDVTDNGSGGLAKKITLDSKDGAEITDMSTLTFANSYSAIATSTTISGSKTLNGGTLENGAFDFEMYAADANGNTTGTAIPAKNNGEGYFSFSTGTLNEVKDYYFLIREIVPADAGDITYDTREYLVTVPVSDSGTGNYVVGTKTYKVRNSSSEAFISATAVEFVNTVAGYNLTLSKIDAGAGTELPGAELSLKPTTSIDLSKVDLPTGVEIKNGAIVWTSTSTPTTIGLVPNGVYEFTETSAPDGYEVAETIYIKVDDGEIYSVIEDNYTGDTTEWGTPASDKKVIMRDNANQIVLSKIDAGAGTELPGAELSLRPVVSTTDLEVIDLPTGVEVENGAIVWTSTSTPTTIGRVPDGVYEFTETSAPDGYEMAETIYVKVDNGDIYSVTEDNYTGGTTAWGAPSTTDKVIMRDNVNSFTFSKVDAGAGTELPGAELSLKPTTAIDLSKVDLPTGVEVENGAIVWTSTSTPTTIGLVPNGVYEFTETGAPDGYEMAETIYVKVDNGDIYSVTEEIYSGNTTEWGTPVSGDTIIMEDEVNKLIISKKILGGNELSGADLTLTPVVSTTDLEMIDLPTGVEIEDGAIVWTSTGTPTEFGMVPDGVYEFTEISAPDGYEVAETMFIKIEDGNVYAVKETNYLDGLTAWGNPISGDTVVMYDKVNKLIISKQILGAGDELEGAELSLTPVVSTTDLEMIDLPTGVEIENGSIVWSSTGTPTEFGMVPDGVYEFTETRAPDGYEVAETIYVKVVNGDIYSVTESNYTGDTTVWGNPVTADTVIMFDEPTPIPATANVSFTKYSDLGKALPGAYFTLTGADSYSQTVKSDSTGVVFFGSVPEGTYTLTETSAPTNYTKASASITVIVNSDGTLGYKGSDGSILNVNGVEIAMTNEVKPVKKEDDVTVGDTIDLGDDLVEENGDFDDVDIEWTTSNPSIAVVDQTGKVTVLSKGEVTITASKGNVVLGQFVLGASAKKEDVEIPETGDKNRKLITNLCNVAAISLVITLVTARAIITSRRKRRASRV